MKREALSDGGIAVAVGSTSERNMFASDSCRDLKTPKGSVEVLLIGSSTGGPQALAKLIPALPADLGIPVLVVQHMPPVFTASLAESLNRVSRLRVVEASDNQMITSNMVYVAPGGRHMRVRVEPLTGEKRIVLSDEAPVNSVRPAVDVLLLSAAQAYGGSTISVILTGMGEDGCEGVRALRTLGGFTLTQSATTCVVYGMPRVVEQSGLSDESVPLENMANRIATMIRKRNPRASLPIRGGVE
jgi:two-component system chemotaxis response regulator CheB